MLYLPCPKCGGKVTTAESANIDRTSAQVKHGLHTAAFAHPVLLAAVSVFSAANFIYRRIPGGGAKRCTKCGHHFS